MNEGREEPDNLDLILLLTHPQPEVEITQDKTYSLTSFSFPPPISSLKSIQNQRNGLNASKFTSSSV